MRHSGHSLRALRAKPCDLTTAAATIVMEKAKIASLSLSCPPPLTQAKAFMSQSSTGAQMASSFFTVGHSRRTLSEFVELLRAYKIELVVDVRHMPRSRTNPQFNRETLPDDLGAFQIGYTHIPELGGLRGKQRGANPFINIFWRVRSFQNYADYALTEQFHVGLSRLRVLGHQRRSVIMCAEVLWWRCHRRIIADYLIAAGESVVHIFSLAQD